MKKAMTSLRRFHDKHGFAVDFDLKSEQHGWGGTLLRGVAKMLAQTAKQLLTEVRGRDHRDVRVERAQLIVEETAEALQALCECDEIELADALADLTYVVVGTAVAYDIPLDAVFDEVHRSNMTKPASGEVLLKGKASKGEGYERPDVEGILELYRRKEA